VSSTGFFNGELSFDGGTTSFGNNIQTYTPTVQGSSVAGAGTYTTQVGFFTTNGNIVFCHGLLDWTAHTGTGNLQFILPVATSATANISPLIQLFTSGVTVPANTSYVFGEASNITTVAEVSGMSTTGVFADVAMDNVGVIRFHGWYFIDN